MDDPIENLVLIFGKHWLDWCFWSPCPEYWQAYIEDHPDKLFWRACGGL